MQNDIEVPLTGSNSSTQDEIGAVACAADADAARGGDADDAAAARGGDADVLTQTVTDAALAAQKALDEKMQLKQSEYDRALEIKANVEAAIHLHNLMDFDYVLYAIAATGETMEQIMARIYTIQCFREHYGIQETPEEGMDLLYQFLGIQQPYLLLDMEYLEKDQSFFAVVDMAQFQPSRVKTRADHRVYLGGAYYMWHCQFPEFRCARIGMTVLTECMDTTLDNFDMKLNRRALHELMKCYPKVDKATYFIHSPLIPSMMYSMWKDLLPAKVRDAFHLDFSIKGLEDTRIDALYKQPTAEEAQARLILKIRQYLQDRYRNRENFRLDNATVVPDDEIFDPYDVKTNNAAESGDVAAAATALPGFGG